MCLINSSISILKLLYQLCPLGWLTICRVQNSLYSIYTVNVCACVSAVYWPSTTLLSKFWHQPLRKQDRLTTRIKQYISMIDIYIQIEHYGKICSLKISVHFFVTYLEMISIWWCIIQYIIKWKTWFAHLTKVYLHQLSFDFYRT